MSGTVCASLCVGRAWKRVCVCVRVVVGEGSSSYRAHCESRKWLLLPQESTIKSFPPPFCRRPGKKIRQFNNKVKGDSAGTSCRRFSGTMQPGRFGFHTTHTTRGKKNEIKTLWDISVHVSECKWPLRANFSSELLKAPNIQPTRPGGWRNKTNWTKNWTKKNYDKQMFLSDNLDRNSLP